MPRMAVGAKVGLCALVLLCGSLTGLRDTAHAEPPLVPSDRPELRLSLHEAIEAALNNNPNVRLVKERILAAQGIADTSRGALLPNLSGFANARNQTVNLAAFGIPQDKLAQLGVPGGVTNPFDVYDLRATLVQNIFSLSLLQRWKAARAGVEVATLDAELTKRDTVATVALLYVEALRAEAAVKASEANIELNQQLLKLAQDRKAVGIATGIDVTREQVQLENERQRLLVAESDRDRATLNVLRALGIGFQVSLVLTDELKPIDIAPQQTEEAVMVARDNRIELKLQEKRERLASLTLSSVISERLPSLAFNGDYGLIGLKPQDAVPTRTVGVTLSVSLFDGGRREARISENRSLLRQEAIRMQDISDQVTLEVHDALLTLASTRRQIAVSQEGLRLALKELELARDRFGAGIANNIEVTNAQASLARGRDNVIEALFRFHAARINLARAQGRLEMLY